MKSVFKKTTAFILASAIGLGSVPFTKYEMPEISFTANAEENLMTRDIWCANEDVNRWESEHFQFIWGKNGTDSAKITKEFLEENAKHLKACWNVFADMSIDVYDFIVMRKIILDLPIADKKKAAADTNGDGKISIADAVILQEFLLGKINEFPSGKYF